MIMEMLENDEENAFTEVEKFIIYFETLDTVANEDKKHINALYEIVEEHKTSLSEGVFIGVMKYLQRQHDKAAENDKRPPPAQRNRRNSLGKKRDVDGRHAIRWLVPSPVAAATAEQPVRGEQPVCL